MDIILCPFFIRFFYYNNKYYLFDYLKKYNILYINDHAQLENKK
jgi:hypothetical protein